MIISINTGGLSNRIKSAASIIRYSKNFKINYKVQWKVLSSYKKNNHILNCPFNLLFKNDIEIKKINETDKPHISDKLLILETDEIPDDFNKFKTNCKKVDKIYNKKFIDFMYNEIPQKIKDEYIECFKELKLIKELDKIVNNFSKNFNDKTISLHIRSWNRPNEKGRSCLYNLNKFEDEINKYDKSYKFFLATDSLKTQKILKKKYKNRILIYPRKTDLNNSRSNPKGLQEDLIELYLLSKNKMMIGSHYSTFTEVAWWLGGCPENIKII